MNGLKLVLNMIDLTTLEGKDTDGKVKQLCYKAMHPHDAVDGIPKVAAVCVYPSMVKVAKKAVESKLANENFVTRAKPEVVAQARERLAQFQEQLQAVEAHLAELSG